MSIRAHLHRLSCRLVLVAWAAVLALTTAAGSAETSLATGTGGPLVLLADQIVQPDGSLKDGMAVVVQGGKIRQVVAAADVQGQRIQRLGNGSVLCPGLIDLCASIGSVGQTVTTVDAIDPDTSAVDAVDPRHADFSAALHSGITVAMVTPAPTNLVSGTSVSFRTLVTSGELDILRDDGPLVFSLGESVWRRERAPTSRAGTLHQLRVLLADANAGKAQPRVEAIVAGRSDAMIFCQTGQDVVAARDALGDLAARFVVVHNDDALDLAANAAQLRRPVVVGPYTFSSSRRVMLGAAALVAGGAEVALRGGFPMSPPEGMRITAALAVRHGMDPAKARLAITTVPAKVAGLHDRVGAIAPDKDADLVVFSGDPLRLDAIVQEVYIQGVRVYTSASRNRSMGGKR